MYCERVVITREITDMIIVWVLKLQIEFMVNTLCNAHSNSISSSILEIHIEGFAEILVIDTFILSVSNPGAIIRQGVIGTVR